jgi:predicted unusual protein kinase regulating ubiquinone biosynthesis (AarF/ABC1/UbiB family)
MYTEIDILHSIQHDIDSKVLDPDSLKLLDDFNQASPQDRLKIVLAPGQAQSATSTASAAPRAAGPESGDPAVKEAPKEIRSLRGLFAECLSPTDPSKIDTQSPALRAKQACIEHAHALLPLVGLRLADEGLRDDQLAALAGSTEMPVPVLESLLELIDLDWARSLIANQGASDDEKIRTIGQALRSLPDDRFANLAQETDRSLDVFKAPVKMVFQQLAEGFEGIPGNLANFLSQAFRTYFEHQAPIDQRTMLASYMRGSVQESTEVMKLASLVAGGGPYMIKMLQLVGDNVTGEHAKEMKEALAFVKSGLPPIAPSIRDAMLLGVIKDSQGKIKALKDIRSLGAASVGETFLAKVEKDDGSSDMVVVKLLRPGIAQRAGRERQFMDAVAQTLPGMQGTFAGIADQIEAEMDLRSEATNVRLGEVYDHRGDPYVQSMKLSSTVPAKTNYMMIERAPGSTLAHYVEHLNRHSDRTPIHPFVLATRMGSMMNALAEKWVEEAIFGSGFYHGDLHAGNIMYKADEGGDKGTLTVIDFGNSKVLSEIERRSVFRMMCTAHIKSPGEFCKDFEAILSPEGRALMTDQKRAEFISKITDAFNRKDPRTGEAVSTGQMIDAILTSANNLGLEVPGPIANFSRSEMMLENAFKELTKQAHDTWESFRDLRQRDPELKQEVAMRTNNLVKAFDRKLKILNKLDPAPTADIAQLQLLKTRVSESADGFESLESDDIEFMLNLEEQLPAQERTLTPAINRIKQTYAIKRDLASIPDQPPIFSIEQAIGSVFGRNKSAAFKLTGLGLATEVLRA